MAKKIEDQKTKSKTTSPGIEKFQQDGRTYEGRQSTNTDIDVADSRDNVRFKHMETIPVQVQKDHIERLCRVKKPILSIVELIWNGLDAEATTVHIQFQENPIGGLEAIRVIDNGNGLHRSDVAEAFGNLGGSWKNQTKKSKNGKRLIHGRMGKGRFRAFALGKRIEWTTRYREDGKLCEYSIVGNGSVPDNFQVGDSVVKDQCKIGTTVEISEIDKNFPSLLNSNIMHELAEFFALYLTLYPEVKIIYDSQEVKPSKILESISDYDLNNIIINESKYVDAVLTIIEWSVITDRKLFLCDEHGFALDEIQPGIQARGFNFTAYLKSDFLRELDKDNSLDLGELHPGVDKIFKAAKVKMREHFRKRKAELAKYIVHEWKEQNIYPYKDEAKNLIENAERQVFDICALELNSYLTGFEDSDNKNKRFSLRLLRNALESGPSAVKKIFAEVLELPEGKQEELAKILETTSLTSLINLTRTVTNRFQFINGLESIIRDPRIKERSHLQHIIESELWIFDEHYSFCSPRGGDITLENVLKAHLDIMERSELAESIDSSNLKDIPDLCLYKQYIYGKADEYENLVIELKRPKVKLNEDHLVQIKKYARAVAKHTLFDKEKTKWTFYLVSTDYNDAVEQECNQRDRRIGHIFQGKNIDIWVKRWSDIIQESKGRLEFVRKQMDYSVKSNDEGLEYLRKKHKEYLPDEL